MYGATTEFGRIKGGTEMIGNILTIDIDLKWSHLLPDMYVTEAIHTYAIILGVWFMTL